MKTLQLCAMDSGDFSPETGIYYANYSVKNGTAFWATTCKIYQYEKFPELQGQPTKWSYFINISEAETQQVASTVK